MNHFARLVLACSLAVVLGGLLALMLSAPAGAGANPTAARPAALIRVPLDYATIQEAINAAPAGAEIRIQGGPEPKSPVTYAERLTITKGITLSGGWSEDFDVQSPAGHPTIVDAEGLGRAISITTATSSTLVTIEALIVTGGDATGLGGWQASAATPGLTPDYDDPGAPPTDTLSLAAILPVSAPPEVQARQAALAKRRAQWGNPDAGAPTLPTRQQTTIQTETVDCGGGIFSAQASLRLNSVYVAYNQASRTGHGYGGGVCIVTAPPGAVTLVNNTLDQNIGAEQGDSIGGGLFIADAPGVVLTGNTISRNRGTTGGNGTGGGAYVVSAGAMLMSNIFNDNVATIAGGGAGGGLMLQAGAGTVMSNSIRYNLASGGALGLGGGLMITGSHTAQVTGNFVSNNLASGAGRGIGGGLHIAASDDVRVERNMFAENTAGSGPNLSSTGGGAYARDAAAVVFAGNLQADC
jgi:hypothetical protein